MQEVPVIEQVEPSKQEDTPSIRALVFLKDPTETFELDLINLEGVIIGMRVDGSAILYIPWARVKHLEVPKSLNNTEDDEA